MASKNIIAKGTTYNGVESVTFPTSPSGTATFYEVSDTTATASDVLNSKYFYTAAGVKTQGTGTAPSPTLITKNITQNGTYDAEDDDADGYSSVTVSVSGGGGGAWSWMGKNPTKVKNIASEKVYLENTSYGTWTPSTTATQLVAPTTLSQETVNLTNKDYILLGRFHTHFEYNPNAVQTAMIIDDYYVGFMNVYGYENNLSTMTDGVAGTVTANASASRSGIFYKNTNSVDSYYATGTYGVYVYGWGLSSSGSGSNTNYSFTPSTPNIYTRCNANYFSTASAAAVDQSASYYEYVYELWGVDRFTSQNGGAFNTIRDMWLNGF